jgi:ATP-binding cassette subfamily B protein
LGDLALYGGAATMLQTTLISLSTEFGVFSLVLTFLPSLQRVLLAPPDLPQAQAPRAAPQPLTGGIAFEHVSFTYPGQSVPVLHDLCLEIGAGECVALVGHNGAGKTTLIKLLLRLYDPTAGRVLLDGVDLRAYDLDALRRTMGVIFQDFVRYELTARENIAVGQIEALGDSTRLRAAAARAGAGSLLDALPKGLDTPLGRAFGGRDLSGGEWQKLALARAFVRDCQLLVLDEPTAALDVQTENAVYARFHELTRGRMTLLISHRFSTVRMADRILYLAGGRVQEEGSHAALMDRAGEYARLYRLQAAQYGHSARHDGEVSA